MLRSTFNQDSSLAILIKTVKEQFEKFKSLLEGHEVVMREQVKVVLIFIL